MMAEDSGARERAHGAGEQRKQEERALRERAAAPAEHKWAKYILDAASDPKAALVPTEADTPPACAGACTAGPRVEMRSAATADRHRPAWPRLDAQAAVRLCLRVDQWSGMLCVLHGL